MANDESKKFIEDYCKEILHDLNLAESDPKFLEILEVVGNRVNARIFLETLAMLTPEQAALVKQDLDKNNPDPKGVLDKVVSQIPNFQLRIVQVLANLRSELLQELKK